MEEPSTHQVQLSLTRNTVIFVASSIVMVVSFTGLILVLNYVVVPHLECQASKMNMCVIQELKNADFSNNSTNSDTTISMDEAQMLNLSQVIRNANMNAGEYNTNRINHKVGNVSGSDTMDSITHHCSTDCCVIVTVMYVDVSGNIKLANLVNHDKLQNYRGQKVIY